jgi:outer membrane protein assembly factor BamB
MFEVPMEKCWLELSGNGWGFNGPSVAGIPKFESSWIYETLSGGFFLGHFVIDEKSVILLDHKHVLQSIDIGTGTLNWSSPRIDDCVGLKLHKNKILVGSMIVDSLDGAFILDIRKGWIGDLPGRFNIQQWENVAVQKLNDREFLVVDLIEETMSVFTAPFDLVNLIGLNGVGGFGAAEGSLSLIDISADDIRWQFEFPSGCNLTSVCSHGDWLYITLGKQIVKIMAQTGEALWFSDFSFIKNNRNIPISVCEDTFHFSADDHLYGYSCMKAEQLWSKRLRTGSRQCIAGDLVFGFDYDRLFACDRYTGEEVWTVSDNFKHAYTVKSVNGHLFVNTTTGKLYCYRWDVSKPYNSPAKPC